MVRNIIEILGCFLHGHSWVYTKGELKRECAYCGKIQHGMHDIRWR